MTALPLALKLLEPSALIGYCTTERAGSRFFRVACYLELVRYRTSRDDRFFLRPFRMKLPRFFRRRAEPRSHLLEEGDPVVVSPLPYLFAEADDHQVLFGGHIDVL